MNQNEQTLTVDVRPELRAGGEPLPRILGAVDSLARGQRLRILATFEPVPLYTLLGTRGFHHVARPLSDGDWEVLFTPASSQAGELAAKDSQHAVSPDPEDEAWPEPAVFLDNRDLPPPEPLVLILETLERLKPGEVLEALTDRDPVLLYPELEARSAAIRINKQDPEGVRFWIRKRQPS